MATVSSVFVVLVLCMASSAGKVFCSPGLTIENSSDPGETTVFESDHIEGIGGDGIMQILDDDDDRPLQLLQPGAGHDRLELNEMVVEMLAAIDEPISFVSVVGPYHGGKSFLLNVLLNSTLGFRVGAVPEPETHGIWIRILARETVTGVDGSRIVLLDTEGFYGEGATRLYDARIFAVATLLSSHLIYNTLRTLGDAQSVSALADLAKQAQVFNLQNWLHTSIASSDQQPSSSQTDVDPFLLLKTLDFPPLTWVVQGFDIDLHSQTPKDHLQRYLEAHAHTGDRTLDTLFTKGISCHTIRTPTDMNQLREQVGGEGLAANTELYSYLHPKYLFDINGLRAGVFGNVKAKGDGNFTGKTIAGLLPLLVHYVNEDFPLNAERKLRDMLLDIVVDGAFSGGVQYFQMSMQEPSMLDKGRGKGTNQALAKLERKSLLSGLATSALTSEELEKLMASAENKAIGYCKQRCVGVPPGLVNPTCDAQLAVKIGRMKRQFRDENERRVREVLAQLGEGLWASAEKEVDEMPLPTRDADLQRHCNLVKKNVLQGYAALVGAHRGSQLYEEACKQMQSVVQNKCDRVAIINMEKISALLNRGREAFQDSYGSTMTAEVIRVCDVKEGQAVDGPESTLQEDKIKPIAPKRLVEINKAGIKTGQEAFAAAVRASGLPWVGPGNERYDFHMYSCLQWSKQRFEELWAQNEKMILAYSELRAADLAVQYKDAVAAISPFPDNDEVVTAKADNLAKQALENFSSSVREFSSVNAVEEKRKELVQNIRETHERLLKRNTALMAAFCYDPLMDAYKELHMQDCEMTWHNLWKSRTFWSRKCLWPGPRYTFGFKHAAYAVARHHLDNAQSNRKSTTSASEVANGVVLSAATRNKVIHAWIEHDLAPHSNTVIFNFSVVSAVVIGLLSFLVWVAGGVGRFQFKKPVFKEKKMAPNGVKRDRYY